MVYIDETGAVLSSVDLKKGFLVDEEWIDYPEVPQEGHYEYEALSGGGRLQRWVVDVPYAPAHREVTVMKYIAYTEAELAALTLATATACASARWKRRRMNMTKR